MLCCRLESFETHIAALYSSVCFYCCSLMLLSLVYGGYNNFSMNICFSSHAVLANSVC